MEANYIVDHKFEDVVYTENDIIYKDFERCTFTRCNFTQANFLGVAFTDCTFENCNFNDAKVNYVAFRDAIFKGCNFTNVNFSMVDSLLFRVEFNDCSLDFAKFYNLKLKGTIFSNCSLVAVDFMNTDLTEVVFDNCNMNRTVFIDAIANKADFTTSYNFIIDPEKNKLKKAKFSEAGLKGLLEKYDIIVK